MKPLFSPSLGEEMTPQSSNTNSRLTSAYLKNFERLRSAKINSRLNNSTTNNGCEYIN